MTQIGYPPLRINILNTIDGVDFKDAFKNKIEIALDDLIVNFIGLQDFMLNKEASGRKQDLLDLKELRRIAGK